VMMLPDALLVRNGGEVHCNLLLAQDSEYSRRYNITVEVPDDDDNEGGDDSMMVDKDCQMEKDYSEQGNNCDLESVIRNTMLKLT